MSQVIATTHSHDCIRGFATALAEQQSSDGALIRLSLSSSGLRAVEYSEEELQEAVQQGNRNTVACRPR